MSHLDTDVQGDPGSCVEAAEWLAALSTAATSAGDEYQAAMEAAQSGWRGPAREAFLDTVHMLRADLDELPSTGTTISTGLHEFAAALTALIGRMGDIRGRAAAGGLELDGTIILAPELGQVAGRYLAIIAQARQQHRLISEQDSAFINSDEVRLAVDAHNARVRLYNDCISDVRDVREAEQQAHRTMHDVIVPPAMELGDVMMRISALSIVFTAGKQAYNAWAGHQSWGEAGINVPSIGAGALAGGANGAAVGTAIWPGVGTVVGGGLGAIGGSIIGGIIGSNVADFLLPEMDVLDGVEELTEMPYYTGR